MADASKYNVLLLLSTTTITFIVLDWLSEKEDLVLECLNLNLFEI